MVYAAILKSNGQTIATGVTAQDAYNAAVQAGYQPTDFTLVNVGSGNRTF
jgi:hypothetical protein